MKLPRLKWPEIMPPDAAAPRTPLWVRIGWMVALWAGSVLVLLAIATVLRAVLLG